MPAFKRTRPKVDETDSESGGSPTIGKRLNKRNRSLGNPPTTHRNSPQKVAIYIVEVKLGANRTVAGLSKLVKESADYTLVENAEEADVVITGIGMRQRLERSVSAELIVRYCCSTFSVGATPTTTQGPEAHRQTRVAGKVDQRG